MSLASLAHDCGVDVDIALDIRNDTLQEGLYKLCLEAADACVSVITCANGLIVSANKRILCATVTNEYARTVLLEVPVGDDILGWRRETI